MCKSIQSSPSEKSTINESIGPPTSQVKTPDTQGRFHPSLVSLSVELSHEG